MAKVSTAKKATKPKPSQSNKINDKKKKLPRGYKECGNCRRLLHIHRYVCDSCGFKHDMKKKKMDILKNLNKVTPKLLRSLIELNDFNQIPQTPLENHIFLHSMLSKSEIAVPHEFSKKRSSKSQNKNNQSNSLNWKNINHHGCYVKMNANLVCICPILDDILVVESIQKIDNLSQSQRLTCKAYGLLKFHKVGSIYRGKSILHYIKNKKLCYQVTINQHIMSVKSISNRIGMLTGRGTLLIADMEVNWIKNGNDRPFELHDSIEITVNAEDQITTFQWIKNQYSTENVKIIIGTLMGHLYIYKIQDKSVKIERFISNAHFQSITAIAQCPLGNSFQCLIATGSYDGTLSIWSINQKQPIYSVQASNRKICGLMWDPGAKFIFIIRDQNQDSGVLTCFFAILKNDESVALSDQIDFRLVKNTSNCKILHKNRSNKLCLVDSNQATVRTLQIEQLRKNSLKRKKVKKEEDQKILKISFDNEIVQIDQIQTESQVKPQTRLNEHNLPLPIIADACLSSVDNVDFVWGITFNGILFSVELK